MARASVSAPTVTVATTSSSSKNTSSSLSAGAIAGIVIGVVFGTFLIGLLVFYLLRRYRRHTFTRVPNPHDTAATHHAQKRSVSSEPLISPVSWPPIPSSSRLHSPTAPPRADSISPGVRESHFSMAEVTHVVAAGTVSHPVAPAILNIPPVRKPDQTPPSPRSQQTYFIRRMIQARAHASEDVSPSHHSSLDFATGSTQDLPSQDEERVLADAERTALADAETRQRGEERSLPVETDGEDSVSIYSQLSAAFDDFVLLSDPLARENNLASVFRRKSSRRKPRVSELAPVAEVPGTAQSVAPNSPLDGQVPHGTASRRRPSADQLGMLPLLTSANFGKESTPSGTTADSISSNARWGSSPNSSGRASRYPSLAPSSIVQPSQSSGSRSDGGTDWRHPPPGLSGLKTLQVGPLRNPHSPVEQRPPALPDASMPGPAPKRAHLREGTMSSVPEVERHTVVEGGIARIDIAF